MYEYNYLEHHGILGMKWGVRRYQRKDGTLTPAGKKRAAKMMDDYQKLTGKNLKYSSMAKIRVDKAKAQQTQQAQQTAKKKTIREMDDNELKSAVTRLQLEKQYRTLITEEYTRINQKQVSKGKKFIDSAIKIGSESLQTAAKDAMTNYLKKQFNDFINSKSKSDSTT